MRRGTILLIEDDLDIQDALRECLEIEDYHVLRACDGREGLLQLASGILPDVILLDLMMPGMDGREFLKHVRGTAHEKIPVIVLTASQEPLPEGATMLIRKPFALDTLLSQIANEITPRDRVPLRAPSLEDSSAEVF